VLDVHTNPANPIIGDRAFGRTAADGHAARAARVPPALAAAGVLACGKHFPGHGDTATDSHLGAAAWSISRDLARLEAVELAPFAAAAGGAADDHDRPRRVRGPRRRPCRRPCRGGGHRAVARSARLPRRDRLRRSRHEARSPITIGVGDGRGRARSPPAATR
jgi:hypothetical protein